MLTKDGLEFGPVFLNLERVACPDPSALPARAASPAAEPALPARGRLRRALLIAVPLSSLLWAALAALAFKLASH